MIAFSELAPFYLDVLCQLYMPIEKLKITNQMIQTIAAEETDLD